MDENNLKIDVHLFNTLLKVEKLLLEVGESDLEGQAFILLVCEKVGLASGMIQGMRNRSLVIENK